MLRTSVELNTRSVDRPGEFLTAEAVAEIATTLEAYGFDACHVTEHPAPNTAFLDRGGHHSVDPMIALSFAAAATSSLRLLTYLYIIVYRNPILAAKSISTLDVMSGGRLIVGVGAGYLESEFDALGIDFDERNELLDEGLEVLRSAWTNPTLTYEGRHFSAQAVSMLPWPVAIPHPPLWIGGNSERAMRRAVCHGNGWAPFNTDGTVTARTAQISGVNDIARRIERLHEYAAEHGRTDTIDVCFLARPGLEVAFDAQEERANLMQLSKAGVTWAPMRFVARERNTMLEAIRRYGDEVLAFLR